jgi:hypothetical protein
MKSLKAELESLASEGLASDSAKARYREVSVELEKIRTAVDKDLLD